MWLNCLLLISRFKFRSNFSLAKNCLRLSPKFFSYLTFFRFRIGKYLGLERDLIFLGFTIKDSDCDKSIQNLLRIVFIGGIYLINYAIMKSNLNIVRFLKILSHSRNGLNNLLICWIWYKQIFWINANYKYVSKVGNY